MFHRYLPIHEEKKTPIKDHMLIDYISTSFPEKELVHGITFEII